MLLSKKTLEKKVGPHFQCYNFWWSEKIVSVKRLCHAHVNYRSDLIQLHLGIIKLALSTAAFSFAGRYL